MTAPRAGKARPAATVAVQAPVAGAPGAVYRSARLYEAVMRVLYGRHYATRHRRVAELIPPGASVVELCCGPGALYRRHLAARGVEYLGLDINPRLLRRLAGTGARTRVCDVRSDAPLPEADYLVIQASLYHFIEADRALIERMLSAARVAVIVTEPVHNVAAAGGTAARLVARLTDPGTGPQPQRYDEARLDALFTAFAGRVQRRELLPGGREKLYVLTAGRHDDRGMARRPH